MRAVSFDLEKGGYNFLRVETLPVPCFGIKYQALTTFAPVNYTLRKQRGGGNRIGPGALRT
jgi:hypothetical protein